MNTMVLKYKLSTPLYIVHCSLCILLLLILLYYNLHCGILQLFIIKYGYITNNYYI